MSLEKDSRIQAYLDTVISQIKWQEVHEQVKSELLSHLEEVVLELQDNGFSEQNAISEAIGRMGDASVLGKQFQQTHVPQKNWPLVATVALLSSIGVSLIYVLESSTLLAASLHMFVRSLIFTGLGIVTLVLLHYCDFRKIRPYTIYLYGGTMLLWLVALLWGTAIGGTQFLTIGPVSIDCTGMVPYLLAISFAGLFTNRDWSDRNWLAKSALLFLMPLLLSLLSNNTPLALMCTLLFLVLLAIAGAGKLRIAGFSLIPIALLLAKMYYDIGGFSIDYLHSASFWGGKIEMQAAGAFHTDYAFSYFLQEFGNGAGIALVAAGAALLIILIATMKEINDRFGRMMVGGITVCLAVQMSWHILMSFGVMPAVAMNLPFISFGGTQTVVHLGAIGAILSIYKRKHLRSISR